MASWKKVALETTAVSFSDLTLTGLSAQGSEVTALVINDSNVVGTRDLGTLAFSSASIPTVNDTNIDIIAGSGLTGTGAFTTNDSDAVDITLAVDIANATDLGNGVASGDLLLVADVDDSNNVKRTSISDAFATVSSGVTSVQVTTDSGNTGADNGAVAHTIKGATESGISTAVSGTGNDIISIDFNISSLSNTLAFGDAANTDLILVDDGANGTSKKMTLAALTDFVETEISSLPNSALANDSIQIGTTSIDLGGSSPTLAGMQGIDFAAGNASIAASIGANTLTIGHADSHVKIAGDLQVVGTTETVDTTELLVEDKTVTLANGGHSAANGDHAGIIIDTSSTDANRAEFVWKDSGIGVAGWQFKDDGAAASTPDMGVAALTLGTADPTSSDMPVGSLFYNDGTSENEGLYLYTTT